VIRMAAPISSRYRDAAIMLAVVVAVTGLNIWLHRSDTPVGYQLYSANGFSFIYPRECTLREAVVFFRLPSYWLGDLQGESSGEATTIMGVVWEAEGAGGVPATMDEIIDVASDNNLITDVGVDTETTLGGKQVSLRGFNVHVNDVSIPGLMAGWISPEGRVFVIYCLNPSRGNDWLVSQLSRMMGSLETEPPPKPR
jgi:hypothetical protein